MVEWVSQLTRLEARDDEIIALFVDMDGERFRLPLMQRRGGGK